MVDLRSFLLLGLALDFAERGAATLIAAWLAGKSSEQARCPGRGPEAEAGVTRLRLIPRSSSAERSVRVNGQEHTHRHFLASPPETIADARVNLARFGN